MTTMNIDVRPTATPLTSRHPRGRGFRILSRLARADDCSTRPAAGALELERREHTPRHRRDDLLVDAVPAR
jgi:hypothetical protein